MLNLHVPFYLSIFLDMSVLSNNLMLQYFMIL